MQHVRWEVYIEDVFPMYFSFSPYHFPVNYKTHKTLGNYETLYIMGYNGINMDKPSTNHKKTARRMANPTRRAETCLCFCVHCLCGGALGKRLDEQCRDGLNAI
jgi:hypothetical protein